jgi:hypothetical protein
MTILRPVLWDEVAARPFYSTLNVMPWFNGLPLAKGQLKRTLESWIPGLNLQRQNPLILSDNLPDLTFPNEKNMLQVSESPLFLNIFDFSIQSKSMADSLDEYDPLFHLQDSSTRMQVMECMSANRDELLEELWWNRFNNYSVQVAGHHLMRFVLLDRLADALKFPQHPSHFEVQRGQLPNVKKRLKRVSLGMGSS